MTRSARARVSDAVHASRRVQNLLWERRLSISTRGVVQVDHPDASLYASMPYASINRVLAALELRPDDVFVDVGCGLGRVVCCAARRPVAQVLGVDLSLELCRQAQDNARRARCLRAPVTVSHGLAEEFDYTACTVVFMFSPFGPDTMRKVLHRIRADRDGLPVRIAYAHPAYPEPFAEQGDWLEQEAEWPAALDKGEHAVAFYRSVAP